MFRKGISYLILAAMIVHCAGRIGIVSYLYEKRHSIAYSIGIIPEIPIAVCSSDYEFGRKLKVDASTGDQKAPNFAVAQEINLFIVSVQQFQPTAQAALALVTDGHLTNQYSFSLIHPIFHPPLA